MILPTQIKNNKIRTDFRPKSGIGHKKLDRNIEIEKSKMKVENGWKIGARKTVEPIMKHMY